MPPVISSLLGCRSRLETFCSQNPGLSKKIVETATCLLTCQPCLTVSWLETHRTFWTRIYLVDDQANGVEANPILHCTSHTHTNRATFQALLISFTYISHGESMAWSIMKWQTCEWLQGTTSIRIDVAWYGVVRGPWWSSRTAKAKLFSSPAEKASLKRRLKPRHRQAGLPCRPNTQRTWLSKKHHYGSWLRHLRLNWFPWWSSEWFSGILLQEFNMSRPSTSSIIMHQLALSCLSPLNLHLRNHA